jgi:hypothetical protein
MTELKIQPVLVCYRQCIQTPATGEQPALIMGALHGHFCDRCYWRTSHALRMAGELVQHVIGQVSGLTSKNGDGSQRAKKTAPLPFNVEAFNDANEIYSRLVFWAATFATRLNRPLPTPAARAWRTNNNRIVGLPNDITPNAARYAISVMANWLDIHLDDICGLPPADDVAYFQDEMRDIYRINARFPREEQPKVADVRCPDDTCKGQVIVYAPQEFEGDRRIVCEKCGRHFDQEGYLHMEAVFKQVRAEEAAASAVKASHKKAAAHLLRKYGKMSA